MADPPLVVTSKFAEAGIRTVLLTTLSTLYDAYARTPFAAEVPVFVVVDVPLRPFLLGLESEEHTVRWMHTVIGEEQLHFLVLTLDGRDPLHFLIPRSGYTARSTAEWLRREPVFRVDVDLASEVGPYLGAAVRHLAGAFWVFETPRPREPLARSDEDSVVTRCNGGGRPAGDDNGL